MVERHFDLRWPGGEIQFRGLDDLEVVGFDDVGVALVGRRVTGGNRDRPARGFVELVDARGIERGKDELLRRAGRWAKR